MLLEDAGSILIGLQSVQYDRFAALQAKLHVLVGAVVHQLRKSCQVTHFLPVERLAAHLHNTDRSGGTLEGALTFTYHAPLPSQDRESTVITTAMIMHPPADTTFTHTGVHHRKWVKAEAHCLELVAEVDLGSQDLEQDNHLLIDALAVLRHQRQDLHGRMLAPLVPCDSQLLSASAAAFPYLAGWRTCPALCQHTTRYVL